MSKSDLDTNATISIIDTPEMIINKIKRAKTDSDAIVEFREGKEGINNLLTIFSAVTERSIEDLENEYRNKGYAIFKKDVGDAIVERLSPIRIEYEKLIKDKDYLMNIAKSGAERASRIAYKTLSKVYRKVGLVQS